MSKKFYRYEDVPLMLASQNEEPVFIFANNVSLGVTQEINVKKFTDDYRVSIAMQTGDFFLEAGQATGILLGPRQGPAVPLSESLEVIKSGQKIIFPGGQSLYLSGDAEPGDYYIFPGEILHGFNKHTGDLNRYTLVFNILQGDIFKFQNKVKELNERKDI